MRRLPLLLLLLPLLVPWNTAKAGELYVVVNSSCPVQSLSRRDVVALFTGRTRAFPTGGPAQAFDHPANSAARASFYQKLTGMDLARINSYWSRLLFTGQVQPPPALADDSAVVARIHSERSAIGYLTVRPQDPSLRVVFVLRDETPETAL